MDEGRAMPRATMTHRDGFPGSGWVRVSGRAPFLSPSSVPSPVFMSHPSWWAPSGGTQGFALGSSPASAMCVSAWLAFTMQMDGPAWHVCGLECGCSRQGGPVHLRGFLGCLWPLQWVYGKLDRRAGQSPRRTTRPRTARLNLSPAGRGGHRDVGALFSSTKPRRRKAEPGVGHSLWGAPSPGFQERAFCLTAKTPGPGCGRRFVAQALNPLSSPVSEATA